MLVSICLYPTCPKVPHWKELSYDLCERFADVDIVDALSWKGILHNLCHNHNFLNGEYFFFD